LKLTVLLISLSAWSQEVEIKVEQLSPSIYMLEGRGGNIGLFESSDYLVMIDSQFANISETIKAKIKIISDKPIAFLINTHMHGDHTGGNANFKNQGAQIIAHENVYLKLKEQQKIEALPKIGYAEQMNLYELDETLLILHVDNAHTDGDSVIYFVNQDILHMGDTYFANRYPYIDIANGGSIDGYLQAHQDVLALITDETKIIPGHGQISSKKELEAYTAILVEIKNRIQAELDKGKSEDEVASDQTLTAKYDNPMGNFFINPERLKRSIYQSLAQKKTKS
jgi:glyoxylase-like metal-dependent hydrolase (beta-lactamase superfamily II)